MNVTLFLLLCLTLQQTPPSLTPLGTQKDSAQPRANTQNKIADSTQDCVHPCSPEGQNTGSDEKKDSDDRYDKGLNHAYEWATIAGVLGGWIVLLIVWRQSQAVINAERAWLMIEMRYPEGVKTGEIQLVREVHRKIRDADKPEYTTDTMIQLLAVAKNQGRTPAWIYEWKIKADFVDNQFMETFPQEPNFSSDSSFHSDKGIRPAPVGIDVLRSFPLKISGKREDGQIILIYGVVHYRDIFGKKRKTEFGWGIWGESTLMPIELASYHKTT